MIHLVGLPHTCFDDQVYSSCAFTSKAVRLRDMLDSLGENYRVYWGGQPDILTREQQDAYFGPYDPAALPALGWDPQLPYWKQFNTNVIGLIKESFQPGDIIALTMGESHREVANAFPGQLIIEPMVGYEGPMRESFWATESYGWLYNRYASLGIKDHRQFDTVIPPFQRASDFELGEDQGYALFLGRHSLRKGPHVASDIAAAAGLPLLTAGNGVLRQEGNDIICTDGTVIKNAAYLGPKNPAERKDLLAHASVVITPTLYIEPGANVAVEALLSGVGVVAPDGGGVFTDTLPREWRYRSLKQAVAAVEAAAGARGSALREHALSKYSMEACAPLYAEWLARLRTLFGDGWYQL